MYFPWLLLYLQIIISVRSKDNHRPTAVEALRRAKFKFPGRQKILQSNKWGFTKYPREVYIFVVSVPLLIDLVLDNLQSAARDSTIVKWI